VILIALGLGALTVLHHDLAQAVEGALRLFHFDSENHFVQMVLRSIGHPDPRTLTMFTVGTFLYGGLMVTEGIGLLLRKPWGAYLTIVATGSFIPVELYSLAQDFSVARLCVLLVNIAVVGYLIKRLFGGDATVAPGSSR
jgi:uncharacterized membrane protein (DUF2068 family)